MLHAKCGNGRLGTQDSFMCHTHRLGQDHTRAPCNTIYGRMYGIVDGMYDWWNVRYSTWNVRLMKCTVLFNKVKVRRHTVNGDVSPTKNS